MAASGKKEEEPTRAEEHPSTLRYAWMHTDTTDMHKVNIPGGITDKMRRVVVALCSLQCGDDLSTVWATMEAYGGCLHKEDADCLEEDAYGRAVLAHFVLRMLMDGVELNTVAYRLYAVLGCRKCETFRHLCGQAILEVLVEWLASDVNPTRMRAVVDAFHIIMQVVDASQLDRAECTSSFFFESTTSIVGEIEREMSNHQDDLDTAVEEHRLHMTYMSMAMFNLYLVIASRTFSLHHTIITYPENLMPGYDVAPLKTVEDVDRFVAAFPGREWVSSNAPSDEAVARSCIASNTGELVYVAPLWENVETLQTYMQASSDFEPYEPTW